MSLDLGVSPPKVKAQIARKKRRDISTWKRSRILDVTSQESIIDKNDEPPPSITISDSSSSSSKAKFLNRYEPSMSMSKEEEVQWRREARKQRNRASAAASRDRTKTRIQELETQVDEWKEKYLGLMERIEYLEQVTSFKGNTTPSEVSFPVGRVSPTPPAIWNRSMAPKKDLLRVQGIPLLLAATQTVQSYPASPSNDRVASTLGYNIDSVSTTQLHLISENSSRQASSFE